MTDASDERIHAAATKREQLLSTIAATEDTKVALTQVKADLAALKGPWYDAGALCSDINARQMEEQKEFQDLRDSHMRKLLGGSKHKEKIARLEKELSELKDWKAKADKTRDEFEVKLDEIKKSRGKLEEMLEQRLQAQIELDALYASVFDGPSPRNPEEDRLETELEKAQEIFDPIQSRVSRAASVVNYIALARMRVNYAAASAARALNISRGDIYDHSTTGRIGGIYKFSYATADLKERHELYWVRRTLTEASQFLLMAHEQDPEVRGFVMPKVADGSSFAGRADTWINTPVTDYLFHREIGATAQGIAMAGAIVDEELRLADAKVDVLAKKRDDAGVHLKEVRAKLHEVRARIFEGAVRGEGVAPAPSYEAVMEPEEAPPYAEAVGGEGR